MDERKELAYHEAGHIVVGHALGLEVGEVTMVSDGRNAGRAGLPVDYGRVYAGDVEYVEAQHACYVAGAVAEELLTGEQVEFVPGGEYHSDWQGASVCVVELAGRDLDLQGEIGDLAFGRARRILEENWEAVAGLATALMASGKLERQQVEELLKGVEDAG